MMQLIHILATGPSLCLTYHFFTHSNWAASQENRYLGFPTRSDTNRAWRPQKMAWGLKFRILEVEGLYYPCSENKGTDQLCGYRTADLHLCFRICKNPVFSWRGSIYFAFRKEIQYAIHSVRVSSHDDPVTWCLSGYNWAGPSRR